MQLDLFAHSHDVMLRHDIVAALRIRGHAASVRGLAALVSEYPEDDLLPALSTLSAWLGAGVPDIPDRALALALIERIEDELAPAAQRCMGDGGADWLLPDWAALATAMARFEFDPGVEHGHAAPIWLRARRWAEARMSLQTIDGWRRKPVPLAWMIESTWHDAGLARALPLLAELAWIAPSRARALADRLPDQELDTMRQRFDAGFDGNDDNLDFAWFPAWAALTDSRWAGLLRLALPGCDTDPERALRTVLELLSLERQGKHRDMVARRQQLRALHFGLFEEYMRPR